MPTSPTSSAPDSIARLPDDVFRARLRLVQSRLQEWATSLADVARIESTETSHYWRLEALPTADYACPFELIVHDDQHFDLRVGPETYEQCRTAEVEQLAAIAEAIGDGRVITRFYRSHNTGAVRSVETIITLADGREWRAHHLNEPLASVIDPEDCEADDQCYVPYRLTDEGEVASRP